MSKGKLYIIAAPSGAGKSSLVKALIERIDNIVVSISYTTRPPRPGEIDGVNYHFVSQEQFKSMIEQDEFLEYAIVFAKVANYYYGTARQWVENQLQAGKNVILEIDWQGALQIFAKKPDAMGIFILPPSLEVLEERLTKRAQDDIDTIFKRMSVAKDEISHYSDYQYIVINDDFNQALDELEAIFRGQLAPNNEKISPLPPKVQLLINNLLA